MKTPVTEAALVLGLAVAVAGPWAGGCGSPAGSTGSQVSPPPPPPNNPSSLGTIETDLTLPGGETVTTVNWTITQGTIQVLTGTYAPPSSTTTLTFPITNVPAGTGYTLTVTATSPDGSVTCAGSSALFTVTAQQTVDVNVYLLCNSTSDGGTTAGGIGVSGITVNCATWTSASATPANAGLGATVALAAGAVAPQTAAISFAWAASAGSIAPDASSIPGQSQATFTCPAAPSTVTITLTVGDGALPTGASCPPAGSTTTLTVACNGLSNSVPCTAAGQTECVPCAGSSGGICTPTEAALVQHDIGEGLIASAGAELTAACYVCLYNAGALDDVTFGDTDHECGDLAPADQAACLATLQCILGSSCAWGGSDSSSGVGSCFCGAGAAGPTGIACPLVGACSCPSGSASGVCAVEESAGLGFPVSDETDVLKAYLNETLPSGVANNVFAAAISNGCTACLR